jgi:hypothetical protein
MIGYKNLQTRIFTGLAPIVHGRPCSVGVSGQAVGKITRRNALFAHIHLFISEFKS